MSAEVTIFADGSAHAGHGGAGIVLIGRRSVLRIARYLRPLAGLGITNQTAELMAAYQGLGRLTRPTTVRLVSDSAYLINCFLEGWIENWRRKDWRRPGGGTVVHRPLWETLEAFDAYHEIEWVHMRGHGRGSEPPAMVRWNAVADRLASTARVERRSWERRSRRVPA